jgi:hypothetical protein
MKDFNDCSQSCIKEGLDKDLSDRISRSSDIILQ